MNVPLNYRTTQEWEKIFNTNGFSITEIVDMGIDEPLAPEHHVLLVADRSPA